MKNASQIITTIQYKPRYKHNEDNIINTIKLVLNGNMIKRNENLFECIDANIEDVIVKVDHRPVFDFEPHTTTAHQICYFERASGDIDIKIKDEKLNSLAHEIQNIIKEKH